MARLRLENSNMQFVIDGEIVEEHETLYVVLSDDRYWRVFKDNKLARVYDENSVPVIKPEERLMQLSLF